MPKRIHPGEIRQWIERYDAGDGVDKIAKSVGKDIRVVRRHIDAALQQRDARSAQRRILEEALRDHQRNVLSVAEQLLNVVQVPGVDADLGHDEGEPLQLRFSLAYRDTTGYHRLESKVEGSREWQLLRQHLPRDPLWNTFGTWQGAVLRDLDARRDLWRAIWDAAEHETGLRVQEPRATPPSITRHYPWVVYQELLSPLFAIRRRPLDDGSFRREEDGSVRFASGDLLLAKAPDLQELCIDKFQEIVHKAPEWQEAQRVKRSLLDVRYATHKCKTLLEELQLLHFVPGRCDLCKRLGI